MNEIVNKYKNYLLIGVVILSVFFAAKSCNASKVDQLNGENKVLKKQVEVMKDGARVEETNRLKQKDSIRLENIKKEAKIKALAEIATKSENKVRELQASNTEKKKVIKNLSLAGVAQELNTVYNRQEATATSNSVDIKGSMPYLILETVADANTASQIIKEKDVQIGAKDSVITVKNDQMKGLSLNLFSAEKSLDSYKELSQLQTDLNKNLEKENSKLRTKNWFEKALIPVAAVAGFWIGAKTIKK